MHKHSVGLILVLLLAFLASSSLSARTGHVFGDPPDEYHPWGMQDLNRPHPPVIVPGTNPGDPPSDAVILFDGTEESFKNWKHTAPKSKRKGEWKVEDGILLCTPGAGYIATVEEFGDCQLHIEWAPPIEKKGQGQGRGNSGVFLMGRIEVQVLDNYDNPTYADGTAGAIYGVMPPMVNSLKGPNAWQSYDIIFRRPIINDGKVLDVGSLTVLVNGVVVQDSVPLNGGGGYRKRKQPEDSLKLPAKGPLSLQDHGNPVRYRNIWIRPLRPRPVDGGLDGRLAPEVTLAKRAETAERLRNEAKSLSGRERAFKLMDSLLYKTDDAVWKEAEQLALAYTEECAELSKDELNKRKGSIIELCKMMLHLRKFERVTQESDLDRQLKKLTDDQGWKVKL
ncbi:MAG: DUF1080 domain-containing protein [Verrucomicrobiota bacterium]